VDRAAALDAESGFVPRFVNSSRLGRIEPGARYRREMPQKKHLPQVTDKEQRMYEHVKESELERGRPARRAKAIAAATVVKHHNTKTRRRTQPAP